MYKSNKHYNHVYMDLNEDMVYYHDAFTGGQLGSALIEFMYADLSEIEKNPEMIRTMHPFFASMPDEMVDDGPVISVQDLKRMQTIYKHLLDAFVQGPSEVNEEAMHYLERHPFYSSGTIMNQTIENENHWMIDYFIMSFEDCLMCELMEMMRRHIIVKVCKNCGRFFIPKRSNIDYCSRIFTEDGRTCSEVGYTKTFARTVQKDELLQAYTRAYKAHYARMTKPRKKAHNMTREEFEEWYREAKRGLELARSGSLDIEAYKAWLKE